MSSDGDGVGILVTDCARLLRSRFDRRARSIGLTWAQAKVLLAIHGGATITSLADRMEMAPITVIRLIDKLEQRGLVQRRGDPTDRRSKRIDLTEQGERFIAPLRAMIDALLEQALADMQQSSRERLEHMPHARPRKSGGRLPDSVRATVLT